MSLTEVIALNPKRTWGEARSNNPFPSVSGMYEGIQTQFRIGGGVRGILGTMAGMSVCGYLAPKMAGKFGRGWTGIAVSGVTALVGGMLINRFSKDKTFGTMFTIGGLGMTGWYVATQLFAPIRPYAPMLKGLGTSTTTLDEPDIRLFGIGEDLGLIEPAAVGDKYENLRVGPYAALPSSQAMEGIGEDIEVENSDVLIPTMTGLGEDDEFDF